MELQPRHELACRQLAEHGPERVGAVELVVAIARDHQSRDRLDPTGEQPQDVERRLVRPVHILEHEHGRCAFAELTSQRRDDLMRNRAARDTLLEVAADILGDREQRAEWARREEGIAGAPQDSRRRTGLLAEPPQKHCLPHPGLAADHRDAPSRAAFDGPQGFPERRELRGALEQVARSAHACGNDRSHPSMVNAAHEHFKPRRETRRMAIRRTNLASHCPVPTASRSGPPVETKASAYATSRSGRRRTGATTRSGCAAGSRKAISRPQRWNKTRPSSPRRAASRSPGRCSCRGNRSGGSRTCGSSRAGSGTGLDGFCSSASRGARMSSGLATRVGGGAQRGRLLRAGWRSASPRQRGDRARSSPQRDEPRAEG